MKKLVVENLVTVTPNKVLTKFIFIFSYTGST